MFTGLKVVELASVLAGPGVGQFFAELGAEVIKVENLKTGGDVTRTWRGKYEDTFANSAYFTSVNWGKKSLAVDLSRPEGKAIVQQLSGAADIVIASYKPGDAEKLGVDYESLKGNNEGLIYGQITGYGSENDRVGYDAVIQAESGFMDLNGEINGPPLKMPVALIDVLAAHQLKEGILLAMLKKQQTGKGEMVEVSLIQTAISSLANQAANYLVAKQLPKRQGSAHPNIAPYGENFITKDQKRVLLAIGSDRQFQDLCRNIGLTSVATDNNFITNLARVKNREVLNGLLQEEISKVNSKDFLRLCNAYKIPAGIIQNLEEVFKMDEAKQVMLEKGTLLGVRTLISYHAGKLHEMSHILPPPAFGEHTNLILVQNLGYSPQKMDLLRQNAVIN